MYLGLEQYRAWADLLHTVKTGEPAFRRMFGDPFEHYDRHPETAAAFDSFMTAASSLGAETISYAFEFPDAGLIVDVGGGEGALLAAILKPRPKLKGVLFDRPSVIEKARRRTEVEGLAGRCQLVSGDFRNEVPAGGDVYVMRNVLHDWDDTGALQILNACRHAMSPTALLVVLQRVMPDGSAHPDLLRSMVEADLMQLVYNGGAERTRAEYVALFQAAGLRLHSSMQADGLTWLMEVRPA